MKVLGALGHYRLNDCQQQACLTPFPRTGSRHRCTKQRSEGGTKAEEMMGGADKDGGCRKDLDWLPVAKSLKKCAHTIISKSLASIKYFWTWKAQVDQWLWQYDCWNKACIYYKKFLTFPATFHIFHLPTPNQNAIIFSSQPMRYFN